MGHGSDGESALYHPPPLRVRRLPIGNSLALVEDVPQTCIVMHRQSHGAPTSMRPFEAGKAQLCCCNPRSRMWWLGLIGALVHALREAWRSGL